MVGCLFGQQIFPIGDARLFAGLHRFGRGSVVLVTAYRLFPAQLVGQVIGFLHHGRLLPVGELLPLPAAQEILQDLVGLLPPLPGVSGVLLGGEVVALAIPLDILLGGGVGDYPVVPQLVVEAKHLFVHLVLFGLGIIAGGNQVLNDPLPQGGLLLPAPDVQLGLDVLAPPGDSLL